MALPAEYFVRKPLPWRAGFLAAHAFLKYRRTGGARRYRTYFPKLRVVSP